MADPLVSVVIPTRQRRAALERALHSFSRQTASPASFEVVVAVDGSTDGTQEMLAAMEPSFALRPVPGPGAGRAAACNAAIAEARGDVLIILDDDMQVTSTFVEQHASNHPPGSRRCVMGAVPVRLDESSPLAARYVQAKFASHLARLGEPDHLNAPRSFFSGNSSLRAEVMREIGGFDETFTAYGNEDVDLALRLRAAGVELRYDPAALANQEYGKDLRELCADTLAKGATSVGLARAHPEVFGALRLAQPWDASRPWLAARSLLLRAARWLPSTTTAIFGFAAIAERLGAWRQPLFYRVLLDYAYWTGVSAELQPADEGDLAALATHLRRGPFNLLLQR